jgi:hypothetical protein
LESLLCTLTPEVQCFTFHRNHVIWQTKITKLWRNGNDSKQPYLASITNPQLKKILAFSVKDRYQLNYFVCIKDFNAETIRITSLKLNLFFFFFLRLSESWKENDLIPTTFRLFRVLTSEMLARRLPVFTLLRWQRQYIIVVNAVNYK